MNAPESASSTSRISVAHRSPVAAGLLSLFAPGSGQIYNKQLEKAVLIWLWFVILVGLGLALLLLGMLARWLPASVPRPPMSDWVRAHAGLLVAIWLVFVGVLWFINVLDAFLTAPRINAGRTMILHPMRWQLVHVLGSQLLGFIPFIGIFFPPGIVAEALDAYQQGRKMNQEKVVREGGLVVLQWMLTRIAFYALWIVLGAWVLWWILRAVGWLP